MVGSLELLLPVPPGQHPSPLLACSAPGPGGVLGSCPWLLLLCVSKKPPRCPSGIRCRGPPSLAGLRSLRKGRRSSKFVLGCLAENQLSMDALVYFSLLICPVSLCICSCTAHILSWLLCLCSEFQNCKLSFLTLYLLKIVLALLSLRIKKSVNPVKKAGWDCDRDCTEALDGFRSIAIFTVFF